MLRPLRHAGYTVSWLLIAACGSPARSGTPIEETWSFYSPGLFPVSSLDSTNYCRLNEGSIFLVRSSRQIGDTVRLAVRSNLTYGPVNIPPLIQTQCLGKEEPLRAFGHGYMVKQSASLDSVFFSFGLFTFSGVGDDVYMSGEWDAGGWDGSWEMARRGIPEADLLRNRGGN